MHLEDGMLTRNISLKVLLLLVLLLVPFLFSGLASSQVTHVEDVYINERHLTINNAVLVAGDFHYFDVTLSLGVEKICIIAYAGDFLPECEDRSVANYYRWEYNHGIWKDVSGHDSSYLLPSKCVKENDTYSFYLGIDQKANPGHWTIKILVDDTEVSSTSSIVIIAGFNVFLSAMIGVFEPSVEDKRFLVDREFICSDQKRLLVESGKDIDTIVDKVLKSHNPYTQGEDLSDEILDSFLVNDKSSLNDELAQSTVSTYHRSKLKQEQHTAASSLIFNKKWGGGNGFWAVELDGYKTFFTIILTTILLFGVFTPTITSSGDNPDIVIIIKATHLDVNYNFVSDIYNDVKEKDNNWSEPINDGEYVRVTFERTLNKSNDITIFARSNGLSRIEVFTQNNGTLITRFEQVSDENWYQVYLYNLSDSYSTFDLRTVGDSVEYEYIIDPPPQTSVDPITSYNQSLSPLTVTATNTTPADNVTLYYRWSNDNSSWDTDVSWSNLFTETWSSGVDNDYEGDDDPDPEGDFSDMWWFINDDNADLTDIQVGNYGNPGETRNCIYFKDNDNSQYGEVRDIGGTRWGPSGSGWTDGYINFTYDYFVDNNEGVNLDVWSGSSWNNVWSDINTAGQNQEAADPGWATASYQLVAADLAASEFSFRIELVGRGNQDRLFVDDITLEVEITSYNWIMYTNDTNPDTSYPWSWSFAFPNGTGYYEFYSIGNKSGEVNETAPSNADAICYFNFSPTQTGEGPVNGSTTLDIAPPLNVTVDDPDDDTLTAYWYSNSTGPWALFDTNNSVDTSTGPVNITQTNENFNNWGTTYWWSVNVTDGISWNNKTYYFTTNYQPSLTNPGPSNESSNQDLTPICNITVSDQDGGTVDVYFYENTTGPWILQQTNSSVDVTSPVNVIWDNYSNATAYADTYYWKVNVTDSLGSYSEKIYHFTTSYPPNLSSPDPVNGSNGVPIMPVCSITISDQDGGTVDVYFYENTTGPWTLQQTNSSVDVTSPADVVWNNYNNASQYNKKYWWKVNVTDEKGLYDGEVYHFTTAIGNPPQQSAENPTDTATNIPINITTINVTITDPDADLINWTIQTSPNIGSDSGNNEGNGSKTCSVSGLTYGTTYAWYVNATDGVDWSNETYTFTTSFRPELNNSGPSNGSTGISTTPVCNITVSDQDGGTVDVYFYENTTGPWTLQQTNSSVDVTSPVNIIWNNYTNASQRVKKYWWKINATDNNGNSIEEIYHFTTTNGEAATIELVSPSPNGTTGINTQPKCQIWANDSDGDTLTVYWYENTLGPWTLRNTTSGVAADSLVNYTFTEFSNYFTTYWWKIAVNDSYYNTTKSFYFTTEAIDTSVDSISPYGQYVSPLPTSATGSSDLANVTLYYHWSGDNSSWGSWSTIFNETWSSGSDTDYEGDDDPDPDGDYSDMWWFINDDDADLTDIQVGNYGNPGEETNCIHFSDNDNNQYGEARNTGGNYWDPSGSGWTDGYINFTYDYYVDNNEGINLDVWRDGGWINVWSDINLGGANQEAADPGWATASYQLVAADLAASQFSFRVELVGPGGGDHLYVDNITLDVTGGYAWNVFIDGSNPDLSYPWSWDFDFPNGTGHYEFYSIGKKSGSPDEAAPVSADAICYYYAATAPVINSYNLSNSTGSKLNNATGLLDVNSEYYFSINITDINEWNDIQLINIEAWFDNGSDSTTYNQTQGSNLNMFLQYDNTSGIGVFRMLWPGNEAQIVLGDCSETVISSTTRIINISFIPGSQIRWAAGDGAWDTTQNATNDPYTWNFNISVIDLAGMRDWKTDEYGIYKYTSILPGQDWVDVIAAPGFNDTSSVVTITYSSNYDFNMSIYFEENLTNVTWGDTIPIANNVSILGNTDPNDDITTNKQFQGIGEENAIDIFNSSGIFHNNNISQTVDVQFDVYIPIGTYGGKYTARVATKIVHD